MRANTRETAPLTHSPFDEYMAYVKSASAGKKNERNESQTESQLFCSVNSRSLTTKYMEGIVDFKWIRSQPAFFSPNMYTERVRMRTR